LIDRLAPEVDVLDQLCGRPLLLTVALSIFGDVARAQRALRFLTAEGSVEFVGAADESAPALPDWQVGQIIDSLAQLPSEFAHVHLRLTQRGYEKFVRDSKGFFDKLFSK
jgi:hypothetical protein